MKLLHKKASVRTKEKGWLVGGIRYEKKKKSKLSFQLCTLFREMSLVVILNIRSKYKYMSNYKS